jgi:diacylglycerol kinase (ATP)
VRVLLLYNPISGSGRSRSLVSALQPRLEALAGQYAMNLDLQQVPTRPEPSSEWLDEHLDQVDLLVVIGGDGAMRLAADSAVRLGTAVYHYPAGTENLFARDFGMEATPERLFEAIRTGEQRRVDVARVGSELCLLCTSMGVDAEVTHDLAINRTGAISHLSYLRPLARQLLRWRRRPPSFEVLVDGTSLGPALPGVVIVGNSRQYALRLDPTGDADNTDGLLDIVQFPARTVTGLALWVLRCRLRRQFKSAATRRGRGRHVRVNADPPARIQIDGDPAGGGDPVGCFEITIEPGALVVLVPPVREQSR